MKYTQKNIVGVKFINPNSPCCVYEVVDIIRYKGTTDDVLLKRSDIPNEEILNTARFVIDNLNSGFFKIINSNYEIY